MVVTPSRQAAVVLVLACLYILFVGFGIQRSTGWVGSTTKNGDGCTCHGPTATTTVKVWIEGPDSVLVGSQNSYRLLMTGGPVLGGGFNVAAGSGSLAASDATAQIVDPGNGGSFELTQTQPKTFQGDTVQWEFRYTALLMPSTDTLFSVGNSVNLNTIPTGDKWNFGADFIVSVHADTSLGVGEEKIGPQSYQLFQNYPNPFNPVTRISYEITTTSDVSLSITDLTGNAIAQLIRGRQASGRYEYDWNASGMASGIYFARLSIGSSVAIRKMLLIR